MLMASDRPHSIDFCKAMTDRDVFIQALETAIAPLYYPSETDCPWTVVTWIGETLTADRLCQWLKLTDCTPVATKPIQPFFQHLTGERPDQVPCAWHGPDAALIARQYQALLDLLQAYLDTLVLYRVGTVEIAIYVMGQYDAHTWMGIATQAVET